MSTTTTRIPITDDTCKAIRSLVSSAQALQSDPENLLPLHTPDVVIVNLAGRRVLGREAYAHAMIGALTTPLRDVRTQGVGKVGGRML